MRHFVQYHNPDVMGHSYKPSHKNFGIVTDKFFASLVGGTVWLVTGRGLWIPQIPSVTNAIEISDMRKGTGGWVTKATGK